MDGMWHQVPIGQGSPAREKKLIQGEIHVGDVVQTRKKHPCSSDIWTVTRTGADIKMRCNGCGHLVMLDRETFLKRRKKVISTGEEEAHEA